jgi:hypothetical protein
VLPIWAESRSLEIDATLEEDPSQPMQVTMDVTQEFIDEARKRGLTGEEIWELAIECALRQKLKQMELN